MGLGKGRVRGGGGGGGGGGGVGGKGSKPLSFVATSLSLSRLVFSALGGFGFICCCCCCCLFVDSNPYVVLFVEI